MAFRVWAGPALLQNTPPCWAQSLLGTCGWSLSCLLRASSVGAKVPQDHFAAPRPELEYWFASLQLPAIVAGRLEPTTQVGDLVGVPRFGTSASSSVFQIHKYRSKFSFKICALGSVYRNISIFFSATMNRFLPKWDIIQHPIHTNRRHLVCQRKWYAALSKKQIQALLKKPFPEVNLNFSLEIFSLVFNYWFVYKLLPGIPYCHLCLFKMFFLFYFKNNIYICSGKLENSGNGMY